MNETRIPDKLVQIPQEYKEKALQQGTLEQLDYKTYESMTYEQKSKELNKTAYVYLPYDYSEDKEYNIFYLMHGGWCNETTLLGTPGHETEFKNIIDHAIQDGKMEPFIIVCPTYNNESRQDSADYSLALILTDNYHNELVNDLIPAVEGKYNTYAEEISLEGIKASRDHRGFGGFSMGSVTTWRTFEYCLDYFRYFMPMSGNLTSDGSFMADIVKKSGYEWNDFFIIAASGTDDFAYSAFKQQIENMEAESSNTFRMADNEQDGNLSFRVEEGGTHNREYANQYTYNGFLWIWNHGSSVENENSNTVTVGTSTYRDFVVDNVLHSKEDGDIHYNLYVPESYDGTEAYAIYLTLPGYQGLYFQGVAQNIKTEEFGFEAQKYNDKMIVVAPQLDDWEDTSAKQTIALVEYFLENYNIDKDKVYASGYSGGGETLSLVMGMRPELFTAYLQGSSKWDGAYEPVVESRTPVYFAIGEDDEYYGSEPTKEAYQTLHDLYVKQGLSEEEIDKLLVLDVKTAEYFKSQGMTNQHGGGGALFPKDKKIMGWLFQQ